MKRIFLPFILGLIVTFGWAQDGGRVAEGITALRQQGVAFSPRTLFQTVQRSAATDQRWSQACSEATALMLDPSATTGLLAQRPAYFALELPTPEGAMTLDLEYVEITTADFSVVQASTGSPASYAGGAHYRGMIRGVPGSLAAISVFDNEIMGLISDGEGDRVLGRLADGEDGMHVFYREADLIIPHTASCGTIDTGARYDPDVLSRMGGPKTVKCVRLYWEVNYDIFQGKGSVTNATNYVTGLFNQSAILYANDGISVLLSQVYVWDVASPYTQTDTGDLLDQFGVTRTSFNGDLGHLLGYAGGGGVAWLNTLCNSQTRLRMAYSDINSTFSNVPTYSWSVEVVTHEQGHNMGSRHTHACAWNGNNTAIDGCGPAAGYTEGTCAQGPLPSSTVGGTIMSYCHLTSSTIKFANGFGPQPTAVIVNAVNNASCLTNCASSCSAPTGLSAGSITTSSALLSWTAASGAVTYNLQWKLASSGTWTTVTGLTTTSYSLTGLAANTAYNFQVMTVCSGGSSAYASAVNFTTSAACGVPANLAAGSTTTSSASLSWTAVSGAVSYNLQWKLASSGTWTTVTGLATASYSLTGLAANTTYNFQVMTVCSGGSSAYATAANFTTIAAACGVPTNLAAGSITSSGATLSWAAVSGAVSYTVQWKLNSASTWTTVSGLVATSYPLAGLSAATLYNFKVMTACSGNSSAYATAVDFTTSAAACTDNYEPNNAQNPAPQLTPGVAITALISSGTDIDWFRFTNTTAQRNIRVTLSNLPANYDLRLQRGTIQLGNSTNSGTTSEVIVYNGGTISTSYRIRVIGANTSTFNATQCYTLKVELSGTPFAMPAGMSEGGVEETANAVEPIILFPNPANDRLTITLPSHLSTATVELLDALGRVLHTEKQGSSDAPTLFELPVADRTEGLYLVRVSMDGNTSVQRLIIAH